MKSVRAACLLCTLAFPSVSLGSDVTDLVQKGLDAYRSYGTKPALRAWEYEGVKEDQLVDRLNLLRKTLGAVHGSQILAERRAGSVYAAVYALIQMEEAPVFVRVTCYVRRGQWVTIDVTTRLEPWDFVPGFFTGQQGGADAGSNAKPPAEGTAPGTRPTPVTSPSPEQ